MAFRKTDSIKVQQTHYFSPIKETFCFFSIKPCPKKPFPKNFPLEHSRSTLHVFARIVQLASFIKTNLASEFFYIELRTENNSPLHRNTYPLAPHFEILFSNKTIYNSKSTPMTVLKFSIN